MQPQFPIYIPSKSRASTATTPRVLEDMGVDYRIVVEEQQYKEYSEYFKKSRLLVLDPKYYAEYDACMEIEEGESKGSGPARNFIWEHSISEGHDWHWTMDDNIYEFLRLHKNQKIAVGDGTIFVAMEDFSLRYENVAMAGPHYRGFADARKKMPPFITGTRVFSCNLIRNDLPFRWRGRYNEDVDLSLRMLKAGWATIQFFAFLQDKAKTQTFAGGNTEAFYAKEGTYLKSKMLVDLHPDVTELAWRFGRVHHHVDYSQWRGMPLIKKKDYQSSKNNPYKMKLVNKTRSGKKSGKKYLD